MDERLKKLLGEGPYPFSEEDIRKESIVETFMGQGMIILLPRDGIFLPKGSHAHESYEFLIPLNDMPNASVENKVFHFEKERLFPLNVEQFHGPGKDIYGCKLLGFQIDKDTFDHISLALCGKINVSFDNESIIVGNELRVLLQMFMDETRNAQMGSDFIQQNIINLIVSSLLRQLRGNAPKLITERNYCERDNINRAVSYLREQYNKNFSLEEVASIANLSPYHFIRVFKTMTGKTPYNYLLDVKIEKAKELLTQKKCSITDICFLCGFNNLEHFSTVFKRKVGILPSQFRKLSNY